MHDAAVEHPDDPVRASADRRTVVWRKPAWDGGAKIRRYRVVVKDGSTVVSTSTVRDSVRKVYLLGPDLGSGKHKVIVRAGNKKGYGAAAKQSFKVA